MSMTNPKPNPTDLVILEPGEFVKVWRVAPQAPAANLGVFMVKHVVLKHADRDNIPYVVLESSRTGQSFKLLFSKLANYYITQYNFEPDLRKDVSVFDK